MTYDPDRTTVMAHVSPEFPITDEYPAVPPLRQKSTARFLLTLVTGLVAAGLVVIGGVFAIQEAISSRNAATADEPEPSTVQEPAIGVPPVETATADVLPSGDVGYWQVTGVPDGLNVREEPGTQSPIVGALTADQRHVFATGERATVNGAEWKQITFGDDDRVGWVSARFLVQDSAPSADAPTPVPTAVPSTGTSVVCFVGQGSAPQSARIEFTNGTTMNGVLRTASGQSVSLQSISGTLSNGEADVTLIDTTTGQTDRQDWVFTPATVVLGDGSSIAVVGCESIANQFP